MESIIKENNTSKQTHISNWSEWFESLRTDWDLFAMTVVFKAGGDSTNESRWASEYGKVMGKLNKKLSQHACDRRFGMADLSRYSLQARNALVREKHKELSERSNSSITYHDCWQYEFGESSWYRGKADRRCVHHIHGIVCVPKRLTVRVWNVNNGSVISRVDKDIRSVSSVSDFLFEPLRENEANIWISYMTKKKPFYRH